VKAQVVVAKKGVRLSEVQLVLMRALWQEGRATIPAVYERVRKRRSMAYTTVATLLKRLENRGLVQRDKQGREHVFEALVSEDAVKRSMVSDLVTNLFRGDARALLSHLVQDAEIDEDDLKTVRRMLSVEAKKKNE
jgi:BlaI family penicillinase repressor